MQEYRSTGVQNKILKAEFRSQKSGFRMKTLKAGGGSAEVRGME